MSNYQDGSFDTRYGTIRMSNPGPLNPYPNINTYAQTNSRYVRLQGPALRAFRAAEARVATKRKPHILITGTGYRSYALQSELYRDEPGRFADPDGSMHVEALAVDVDQGQGFLRLRSIHKALLAEGWHQSVAGEPWHYSFRLSG